MNKYGLTAENQLSVLPQVLRDDPTTYALASITAEVLAAQRLAVARLLIYPQIDSLPEELLDILAYDFKVDWWDPNYTLEEKRRTFRANWTVHKMLGTKAAVETALSAIYPDSKVVEWFEYSGDPYSFRLQIDATNAAIDTDHHRRVLSRVSYYKNLRSHLESIKYTVSVAGIAESCVGSAFYGSWMRVGVNVQIDGDVDWPHSKLTAQCGIAQAKTYMKLEVQVHGME